MAAQDNATVAEFIEKAYATIGTVDSYYLLGVARDASAGEIRTAYYRLAERLHPDLHGATLSAELHRKLTSVFSRVVEAYQVLSDGERRSHYDRGLAAGKLRWDGQDDARPRIRRPEEDVPDGAARKFFCLGRDALLAGNLKAAVMNLELAASMEPGNPTIQAELGRARGGAEKP